MNKNVILIRCNNAEDAKELLEAIKKYKSVTWNNNSKEAFITEVDSKNNVVELGKSQHTPSYLRL